MLITPCIQAVIDGRVGGRCEIDLDNPPGLKPGGMALSPNGKVSDSPGTRIFFMRWLRRFGSVLRPWVEQRI